MSQPSIPHLRSDIEQAKEGIRANMQELGDKVGTSVERIGKPVKTVQHWQDYVERYPLAAVGIAALAGLALSGVRPMALAGALQKVGKVGMRATSMMMTLQKLQNLKSQR